MLEGAGVHRFRLEIGVAGLGQLGQREVGIGRHVRQTTLRRVECQPSQALPGRKQTRAIVEAKRRLVNRAPDRLRHRVEDRVAHQRVAEAQLFAPPFDEDASFQKLLRRHRRIEREWSRGPRALQLREHATDLLGDQVRAQHCREPGVPGQILRQRLKLAGGQPLHQRQVGEAAELVGGEIPGSRPRVLPNQAAVLEGADELHDLNRYPVGPVDEQLDRRGGDILGGREQRATKTRSGLLRQRPEPDEIALIAAFGPAGAARFKRGPGEHAGPDRRCRFR